MMKRVLKIMYTPIFVLLTALMWILAKRLPYLILPMKIVSALIGMFAIAVALTYSLKNGVILIIKAIILSPIGLPMVIVQIMNLLQKMNIHIRLAIENLG